MNEIKVKRLFVAGLATFAAWIAAEIVVEQVVGRILFGNLIAEQWFEATVLSDWGGLNHLLNIFIGLLNSTILIWLYASLRPMYGVGTKTALITSAVGVIWGVSLAINTINLGLIPPLAGSIEALYVAIEFPIAMIAGATVYEGSEETNRKTAS